METAVNEKGKLKNSTEGKRKKGFLKSFYNFLAYGGFLLVLIVGFAIYITVALLVK